MARRHDQEVCRCWREDFTGIRLNGFIDHVTGVGCCHVNGREVAGSLDLGVGGIDADIENQLQAPPVSAPDHCSCCLALRPIQLEPARGRGADAGTWRGRFV